MRWCEASGMCAVSIIRDLFVLDGWRASNEIRLRTNEAQLAKADARKERRSKLNDDLALVARGDHLAGRQCHSPVELGSSSHQLFLRARGAEENNTTRPSASVGCVRIASRSAV